MLPTKGNAGVTSQFIVVAELRAPFVVPTAPRFGIEPEAALLRFLSTVQPQKRFINLANQLFGNLLGPKGMRSGQMRIRDVEQHGRSDSLAAQTAAITGGRLEDGELNAGKCHGATGSTTALGTRTLRGAGLYSDRISPRLRSRIATISSICSAVIVSAGPNAIQ